VILFLITDYTLNDNSEEDDTETDNISNRVKRQTETYEYTPTKTRCPLLLVADYRFYQEMGASSTKTTINYLVSVTVCNYNLFIYNHILTYSTDKFD